MDEKENYEHIWAQLKEKGIEVVETDDSDSADGDESTEASSSSCSSEAPSPEPQQMPEPQSQHNNNKPRPTLEEALDLYEPVEKLNIKIDTSQLRKLGAVRSTPDTLVLIQSDKEVKNKLQINSVLFRESGDSLGKIEEILGSVSNPIYIVRFSSAEEISESNIRVGNEVFYAPDNEQYTTLIMVDEVRRMKFSDASGERDQEVDVDKDFSDDEEEEKYKKKLRKQKKRKEEQAVSSESSTNDNKQKKNRQNGNGNNFALPSKSHSFQLRPNFQFQQQIPPTYSPPTISPLNPHPAVRFPPAVAAPSQSTHPNLFHPQVPNFVQIQRFPPLSSPLTLPPPPSSQPSQPQQYSGVYPGMYSSLSPGLYQGGAPSSQNLAPYQGNSMPGQFNPMPAIPFPQQQVQPPPFANVPRPHFSARK